MPKNAGAAFFAKAALLESEETGEPGAVVGFASFFMDDLFQIRRQRQSAISDDAKGVLFHRRMRIGNSRDQIRFAELVQLRERPKGVDPNVADAIGDDQQ